MNTARRWAAPSYETVLINGTNHGRLVESNRHYQDAMSADPNRPLVYMSCNAGNPSGNAASTSANYLRGTGRHAGDIYAPTGTGVRIIGRDASYYAVRPGRHGGSTIPGEFRRF